MTTKSIRQLFVERLAKVGLVLINHGTDADPEVDGIDAPITNEQFAELDAALADIEKTARTDELSKIADLPEYDPDQFENVDDYLNQLPADVYRVAPGTLIRTHKASVSEGRAEQRRAGLNDDGELPELILPNVNAVNVMIDANRNMFVEVDGVNRLTAGDIDRLVIVDKHDDGDVRRYVVLRDGEPLETIPNELDVAVAADQADMAAMLSDDDDVNSATGDRIVET